MYFYPMNKPLILLSPSKGMRKEAVLTVFSLATSLIFPKETENGDYGRSKIVREGR
jgi:hypothetical protein